MSRTGVRRRRLAATVLVAMFAGAWAGPVGRALAHGDARPVAQHRYVVRPGDTLWSIATRLSPGADPRPLVDAMAASNAVDPGALMPGQILVVPANA